MTLRYLMLHNDELAQEFAGILDAEAIWGDLVMEVDDED